MATDDEIRKTMSILEREGVDELVLKIVDARRLFARISELEGALEACAGEFERRANENRGLNLARVSAFTEAAETVRERMVGK